MKYTDLILLDIKHIDEQEHIKLTGQTNKNILAMAEKLSDMGNRYGSVMYWFRSGATVMITCTGWQISFTR